MLLSGIHPIAEALRAGRPLERLVVAQGAGGPRLQEIIDMARRAGVPVRFEPRAALDRLAGSSAHQGVVALGAAASTPAWTPRRLRAGGGARWRGGPPQPRRHHPYGPRGRRGAVIIPERRAATLTDVVAKPPPARWNTCPWSSVTNINRTLEELKDRGFWIYGLDERGDGDLDAPSSPRRPRWSSGARARACTNRSASTATPWCEFPWRARSLR